MDWYYDAGGESVGPMPRDEIGSLIRGGKISRDTMVWTDGMDDWQAAGQQTELGDWFRKGPPPLRAREEAPTIVLDQPVAPSVEPEFELAPPSAIERRAGPWSRYFARQIDIVLLTPAIAFAGFYILVQTAPSIGLQLEHGNQYIPGFLALPVAMAVNAIITAIFGNSIGKAILGIRATPVDGRLRFGLGGALRREFAVYFAGLGIGFPLFSLITCIVNFREVVKTGGTGYDRGKAVVRDLSGSAVRRTIGILVAIAIIAGWVFLNAWLTVATEPQSSQWSNPLTGVRVTIPAGWSYQPQQANGATLYGFVNTDNGLVVFLADEQATATISTIDQYTAALTANLASAVSLGPWQGQPAPLDDGVRQSSGMLMSSNSPEMIYTWMQDNTFWRAVFIDQVDKTERDIHDPRILGPLLTSTGFGAK